jgi:hypothetical protein
MTKCTECGRLGAVIHTRYDHLCKECATIAINVLTEAFEQQGCDTIELKGRMYRLRDAAAAGNRLWRAILGGGPGTPDDKMLEIQVAITETTAAMHKLEPGDLVAPPRGD